MIERTVDEIMTFPITQDKLIDTFLDVSPKHTNTPTFLNQPHQRQLRAVENEPIG